MTPRQSWTLVACAVLLTLGGLLTMIDLHYTQVATRNAEAALAKAAPDLTPTVAKMNASMDKLIPLLAKADTAMGNLSDATGDWSDASKQQARDVRALLASGGRAVDAVTEDAKALKPAIVTAQGTAQAASDALGEAQGTIHAAQPLLASLTRNSDDVGQIIKDNAPSLHLTLENAQVTTSNIAGVTSDLRKVSDKAASDYLAPKPWYLKVGRYASDAFDYGAMFARHVP